MITNYINSWMVSALLAVGLVLMAFGWSGTHNTLIKERALHQAEIKSFVDAQNEANIKAESVKRALEKKAIDDAKEADRRYGSLLAEYRANLLRFKASQSSPSGPSDSGNQAASSSSGPSTGTQFSTIVITMKDAEICAINTARLQAVHDWALTVK